MSIGVDRADHVRTTRTKVMVLVDTLLAGGAERLAVELACAVDGHRYDVQVVASRSTGPLEGLLDAAGIPLTVLGRKRTLHMTPWRRAVKIAREADLIHAHKFGSNVWAAALSRVTRTPLIAHEHNFSASATALRSLIDRRWIASTASRLVCVSESVADVQRRAGVPDSVISTIPNGVRMDAAWPRIAARGELGLADDAVVVGIVGRLRPEKAHEVLIDALAQLRHHGVYITCCIVGDGPRRSALEEHATSLGVGDMIHWAGEHDNAARLAAAFDVAVVCSDWEGLPLAALEAMAAGVPVVATRVGGLPDLLAGDAGVLVSPRNPNALGAATARLLSDPERARAIARRGQRRVQERHSFSRMVRDIEALYADVIAANTSLGRALRANHSTSGEAA